MRQNPVTSLCSEYWEGVALKASIKIAPFIELSETKFNSLYGVTEVKTSKYTEGGSLMNLDQKLAETLSKTKPSVLKVFANYTRLQKFRECAGRCRA